MSFSYAVPLSVFGNLFRVTDKSLHSDLVERLRTEIHADLARRVAGPGITTAMGPAFTSFDSAHTGGDIIFYGDEMTGQRNHLFAAPKPALTSSPSSMSSNAWRYPGDGGNGLFASSVNAVLSRSNGLGREFKSKSNRIRSRRT